jgi:hypothetical protein
VHIAACESPSSIICRLEEVFVRLQATIDDVDLPKQSFEVVGYLRVHWRAADFMARQLQLGNKLRGKTTDDFTPNYGNQTLIDDGHHLPIGKANMWQNVSECAVLAEYAGFNVATHVVTHQFKFKATFREEFEMNYFPFDRQMCHMILNARGVNGNWSYCRHRPDWLGEKDRWDHPNICMAVELGPTIQSEYVGLAPPAYRFPSRVKNKREYSKSKLTFIVRLERNPTFYLLNLVLPTFVIGTCTLVALLPSLADFSDRLQVTLTMLLTSVAFKLAVSNYIPR